MNSGIALRRSGAVGQAPRAARAAMALLSRIAVGQLRIELPDGSVRSFGTGRPMANMRLENWRLFEACLRDGDIGLAETYIAGDWQCDSLIELLRVLVANRNALERAVYGSWVGRITHRIRHLLKRNTRAGSRRNIHAHYDLGNAFYALWLDETMSYSSALFEHPTDSLADAQRHKYDRILEELKLDPGASILEIGCGWGGFAEQAARRAISVRGLTLSHEQLAFARQRMTRAGFDGQVEIALRDYRDETERHDAVVSIEMFEAVGEAYWDVYFNRLGGCLRSGGRAVVQTITIDDALFDRYRASSDFIQQYIFPGGMLPSPSRFEAAANRAGLDVVNRLAFGADYAKTLACWRQKFNEQADAVAELGFDRRFMRTWNLYLAYCEAAFEYGNTNVIQFTLVRR